MGVPQSFYLLRTVDFAVGWGYGIGQNYRFFILAGSRAGSSSSTRCRITYGLGKGRPGCPSSSNPYIYDELRRTAHRYLGREKPNHTLQSTALVHEVYLRLANQKPKHFQDHSHFIAVVGQLMRQILVDYARNSRAIKRGGGAFKLRLDAVDGFPQTLDVDFLRLDDALKNLREMDAQQSRLVELRFFSGLSIEETAEVLGVSPATLKCRWTTAKAYLYRDMHH